MPSFVVNWTGFQFHGPGGLLTSHFWGSSFLAGVVALVSFFFWAKRERVVRRSRMDRLSFMNFEF